LTPIDLAVVAAYAAAVLWVGLRASRSSEAQDLLLAERSIPGWAVLCSMVATELSAATFIGVPHAAYTGDWSYLQLAFGALLGKGALSLWVIPLYHRRGVITVYGLLAERFGPGAQRASAACFTAGRVLASGVRLFIAALAFSAVTGAGIELSVLACAALAAVYTVAGGIRAVIWTDVLQGAVFLLSALACVISLWPDSDGFGSTEFADWAAQGERLRVFWPELPAGLDDGRALLVGVLGGFFLTLATHGTDQDMVQRLLAARSGRSGGLALFGSALLNFPLTALFLLIGSGIAFHYSAAPPAYDISDSARILPLFALHELAPGLRGLVFAGLFAAAMSSFDSAVCAIASAWVVDVRPRPTSGDGDATRRRMRRVSLSTSALLALAAIGMAAYQRAFPAAAGLSLVDLALSAMTILYGGLLGVFGLAVLSRRRGSDRSAMLGLVTGALAGALLFVHPILLGRAWITWQWWIPLAATLAFVVAAAAPAPRDDGSAGVKSADPRL